MAAYWYTSHPRGMFIQALPIAAKWTTMDKLAKRIATWDFRMTQMAKFASFSNWSEMS